MLSGTRKLRLIMRGIRRQPRKKFKPTFETKNNYASLHIEFIRFSRINSRLCGWFEYFKRLERKSFITNHYRFNQRCQTDSSRAGRSWQNNSWMKIDSACSSWLLGWLMIKPLCCLFEMKIHGVYWNFFCLQTDELWFALWEIPRTSEFLLKTFWNLVWNNLQSFGKKLKVSSEFAI